MTELSITRRAALLGGAVGIAGLLAGCGSDAAGASLTRSSTPDPSVAAAEKHIAALEPRLGGRLGFVAVDTGDGRTIGHRADERFLMCSTHKVFTVAAILYAGQTQPGLLDQRIRCSAAQAKASGYAPITSQHVDTGMTVAELCDAALTHSDNLADRLLMQKVGGPAAVTSYVRTLGDRVTRLDRYEPDLNHGAPGDPRDTSTPVQFASDLQTLVLGSALASPERDRLTGWMRANTTGGKLIRAGVPGDWQAADKTGSGYRSEENDVAVLWPPHHAPLVVTAFTAPDDPHAGTTKGQTVIAAAAKIAADTLVAQR